MATPRSQLIDPHRILHYHLVSRCVRRGWLCGRDPVTQKNYQHRRKWLEQRLHLLVACFAVSLEAYAIMSNHFHLIVKYDPLASKKWDDEEVAERWYTAFPPMHNGEVPEDLKALRIERMINNEERLAAARTTLGSLSLFMKALKQPIALKANREDGCNGHFFEQRFFSGALLNEAALISAMAYVDLNPIRAKIARSLRGSQHTSIGARLKNANQHPERLRQPMLPLASGIATPKAGPFSLTLNDYQRMLNRFIEAEDSKKQTRWWVRVASFKRRQKAYGSPEQLKTWAHERGQHWLQAISLPE
jgi:REP element-mobilizing transposase RayT